MMYKRILLCFDGSRASKNAALSAGNLAALTGADIKALIVFDPNSIPAPFIGAPGAGIETAVDRGAYAHTVMDSIEGDLIKEYENSDIHYSVRREIGHPVDRIIAVAKDENVDLIVLGRRGLGVEEEKILGSVSNGVLHLAHCAALVIPS